MKREGHPELTALAWSALAAIRRSKEAATAAGAPEGRSDGGPDRGDPAEARRGQGGRTAALGGEVMT